MKNRDLWDIAWLCQQGVEPHWDLLPVKVADHRREWQEFAERLRERTEDLARSEDARAAFVGEMRRFLPAETVRETIENPDFWDYLSGLLWELGDRAVEVVRGTGGNA